MLRLEDDLERLIPGDVLHPDGDATTDVVRRDDVQTADVGEEAPESGKAVDAAIALFSGRSVSEVSDPAKRVELKAEFLHQLQELYEGEVMDVYLTNYVTQ